MKTGFFQSISGNRSSSRLIGFLVISNAMLAADFIICYGLVILKADLFGLCLAAGGFFIQTAGPAMIFVFNQKKYGNKPGKNKYLNT